MTIIIALLGLSFLILVHELGHYLVARMFKIPVVSFSIGFGPVLLKWKGKGLTEFSLRAILLGGYVRFLEEDLPEYQLKKFDTFPPLVRCAVVLAGPLSNLLLAYLLYILLGFTGVNGINPIVGEVKPGSIAADAKINRGDKIIAINDKNIYSWQDIIWAVIPNIGDNNIKVKLEEADGLSINTFLNTQGINPGELEKRTPEDILGMSPKLPKIPPVIGKIVEKSAAAKSSLEVGDQILKVNGENIESWKELSEQIALSPAKLMNLEVLRDNESITISLTPQNKVLDNGQNLGFAGISPPVTKINKEHIVTKTYSWTEVWGYATHKTYLAIKITFISLYHLILGDLSIKNLSGPVSIVKYVGDSFSAGMQSFIQLLAYINLSLFIFNLLPLPVLDGGHLVIYAIEIIRGKKPSAAFIDIYQRIGFFILFSLFIFVTFNDISRLL